MNKNHFHLIVFVLIVCFGVSGCQTVAPKVNENQATHLFNKKDLSNFYIFLKGRQLNEDPKKVFTVENGELRVTGEEWGSLTTEQEYENYHLIVEYKWGEKTFAPQEDKARDSGIWIHSVGKDGAPDGAWMDGIEINLIEGGSWNPLVVDKNPESPIGQWNRCEIVAKDQDIYVFLNNVLVNRVRNVKPHKGKIQIQAKSAEIFIQRIDLFNQIVRVLPR